MFLTLTVKNVSEQGFYEHSVSVGLLRILHNKIGKLIVLKKIKPLSYVKRVNLF